MRPPGSMSSQPTVAREFFASFRRSLLVVSFLALPLVGGTGARALLVAGPAAATGPMEGLITDRTGDANVVSDGAGQARGVVPGSTAGAAFADITAAWVSTDYRLVPAVREGVRGQEKAPYGFATHIRLVEPPRAVGPGTSYVVRFRHNTCTFTTIVKIRGALPDSDQALLNENCGGGYNSNYLLGAPEISGTEVVVHVPFGRDSFGNFFDGGSIGEIDAYSAHSDPVAFNVAEVIDYAPSEGPLGFFELGSDLHPRFIPGESAGIFSGEPGSIITLAGGRDGDGLPGPEASVYPSGLAIGPHDGLVYISDFWHHRIRRVAADGTIEPFVGGRFSPPNHGESSGAPKAAFRAPTGLDFDSEGNLYVADYHNQQVRKITPERIVTRIAGTGKRAFSGDGGPARAAALAAPLDVAVDSEGNVFIADSENLRVRRVDAQTGEIETYAGGGLTYEDGAKANEVAINAQALAIDDDDDLYVMSFCRVHRIDSDTQTISTVVGGECGFSGDGGPATEAQLGRDIYVGLDITPDGRLWIADAGNHRVRVVDTNGIIHTFAGNGTATGNLGDRGPAVDATLRDTRATAVDSAGNVYIATEHLGANDTSDGKRHDRVRVVRPDGTIDTYAGNGTDRATPASGRPAIGAGFGHVNGLAWDERDRLYIATESRNRSNGGNFPGGMLWRLDPDGRLHHVAGTGALEPLDTGNQAGAALSVPIYPMGIDVGADGRVYFADGASWQIKVYDPAAETIAVVVGKKTKNPSILPPPDGQPATSAELIDPRGVSVADDGTVYFTEADFVLGNAEMGRVRRLRDGKLELVAGLADGWDAAGFNGDGLPATQAMLYGPSGVEALPSGDVLISEVLNRRVRLVDAETGVMSTVAGDGAEDSRVGTVGELSSLEYPRDVESDGQGGFFVADGDWLLGNQYSATHIVHVSASGMTSYVAGSGVARFGGGDDGPALAQTLGNPRALALGDHGLAFADYDRVRLLVPPEEGWPNPPREPVCLPNASDIPGDTEAETVSLHDPNFDVRGTEVRTIGNDLEVTIELEDLDPATMWTPDVTEQWPGWVYQIWAGTERGSDQVVGTKVSYLGAFATASIDDPTGANPGGFVFEVGERTTSGGIDAQEGRERYMGMRRLGPAEGSVDFETDTVTIRAPLASLGFELGDHTFRQYGIAGKVLQRAPSSLATGGRALQYYDATPLESRYRTIVFGRNCPDAWI